MQKVTLQFATEENLWKFWRHSLPPTYSVNLAERLLTQNLSEEQIKSAISEYGATVVKEGKNSQSCLSGA